MPVNVSPDSTIAELRAALDTGAVSSVELIDMYLNRIAAFDRSGITLNAVPILNPNVFAEAAAADDELARGEVRGPLHGVPFTVKDSYKVAGMTVANGSPAFGALVANEDSASVQLLRAAGGILVGRTTMPPMAAGGMQRGIYGRPISPFNPDCMPAAWLSGSSSGSAVSVSAALAAFSLGEETLSSGRSPASNNGIATYTPSRGLISIRGNWPLMALRDVVAPYARSLDDLLTLLDVLVTDDSDRRGDLWRSQPWVQLPRVEEVRPGSFADLRNPRALEGKVVGVPRIFTGRDTSIDHPVQLRASIKALWERAEERLRDLGARVIDVDPPAFYHFDKLKPDTQDMIERRYWSEEFSAAEFSLLAGACWDEFLRLNGDPGLPSLEKVNTDNIYPDEFYGADPVVNPMPRFGYDVMAQDAVGGSTPVLEIKGLQEAMEGLERFRKELLEDWMEEQGVDILAFPANSDVAPADADVSLAGALAAWKPGAAFSQGGWCLRPLGIPTAQVSMGLTEDLDMPVGITFAGRAYSDNLLLSAAFAFESVADARRAPAHAPVGVGERSVLRADLEPSAGRTAPGDLKVHVDVLAYDGQQLAVLVTSSATEPASLTVTVDGALIAGLGPSDLGREIRVEREGSGTRDSVSGIQAGLVVALISTADGATAGAFAEFDAPTLDVLPRA